jgi:hypothetical protein
MRPGALEIHTWLNDPTQRPVIVDLLRKSLGVRVDLQRTDLREYAALLTRAFESGDLRARKMKLPHLHRDRVDEAPPPVKTEEKKQKHVLDFVVEYPDGKPAPGYEYVLLHPSGKREDGKLAGDATIHRDGVDPGSYGLHIKEIERVNWDASVASVAEEIPLSATATGFADGTMAKVRIFREYAEADDEVVDTFQATIERDRLATTYRYDDTKSDRKHEQGVVRLVAEVSIGKYWAKTTRPVELQLKTIVATTWNGTVVHDGATPSLTIEATGYDDGTPVKVKLWRFVPEGDDQEALAIEDATLAGGVAKLDFTVAEDPDAKKAIEGRTIFWSGEYHAEIEIGADAPRLGVSKFLAVVPAARLFPLDEEESK